MNNVAARENNINPEMDQISSKVRESIGVSARPAPLNDDILSLNIAQLAQALLESLFGGPGPERDTR